MVSFDLVLHCVVCLHASNSTMVYAGQREVTQAPEIAYAILTPISRGKGGKPPLETQARGRNTCVVSQNESNMLSLPLHVLKKVVNIPRR